VIKLKRLKINRYRNVEPCELVFSDRFNILLGPNGAGKTTLLNLISKVLRTHLRDASDPLSIEIALSTDNGLLTGTIETVEHTGTDRPELPPEMRTVMTARPDTWPTFDFQLTRLEPLETIEIRRTGDAIAARRSGFPDEFNVALGDITVSGLIDVASLLASFITSAPSGVQVAVWNARRFDESLDMFRAITAREDSQMGTFSDFRIRILGAFTKNQSNPQKLQALPIEGIVPQSILSIIKSRFKDGEKEVLCEHSELPFLLATVNLLGLRGATAEVELTDKKVFTTGPGSEGTDNFHFGNLKFWFTRKDGSIFQDQHLSYGQKRLLTFLYYLEANPSIIIADELVNGLHHAWIKECMEAIGDRQAFLTSQNPLLLDYLFFDSVEQVKQSFILCRTEPVGNSEKMIWRNLTDDEAEMFYSAYKVGIEHVGEILRTRGLW
jgi:energy-coupling factor transporter ATP-binding protein EcfA2